MGLGKMLKRRSIRSSLANVETRLTDHTIGISKRTSKGNNSKSNPIVEALVDVPEGHPHQYITYLEGIGNKFISAGLKPANVMVPYIPHIIKKSKNQNDFSYIFNQFADLALRLSPEYPQPEPPLCQAMSSMPDYIDMSSINRYVELFEKNFRLSVDPGKSKYGGYFRDLSKEAKGLDEIMLGNSFLETAVNSGLYKEDEGKFGTKTNVMLAVECLKASRLLPEGVYQDRFEKAAEYFKKNQNLGLSSRGASLVALVAKNDGELSAAYGAIKEFRDNFMKDRIFMDLVLPGLVDKVKDVDGLKNYLGALHDLGNIDIKPEQNRVKNHYSQLLEISDTPDKFAENVNSYIAFYERVVKAKGYSTFYHNSVTTVPGILSDSVFNHLEEVSFLLKKHGDFDLKLDVKSHNWTEDEGGVMGR